MGLVLPIFNKVRHQARNVINMNNQKQVVAAANLFALDNDDRYPESVAYVSAKDWNWSDPRTLASWYTSSSHPHRAMAEYLRDYIEDASLMFCPNAIKKPKYLQDAWDAGDDWDNPDTPVIPDAIRATYCFYWNYVGWLEGNRLFRGPIGPSSGCDRFANAELVPEYPAQSAWWSGPASGEVDLSTINVKLHAGYTDGHVESYTPAQAVPMKVIKIRGSNTPYSNELEPKGPGDFYIPKNGLR